MERLKPEIALLEMRSEQLRIHLRAFRGRQHPEARKVKLVLNAMGARIKALKQFARATGTIGRSKPTLH
jgi:hypothetical protein